MFNSNIAEAVSTVLNVADDSIDVTSEWTQELHQAYCAFCRSINHVGPRKLLVRLPLVKALPAVIQTALAEIKRAKTEDTDISGSIEDESEVQYEVEDEVTTSDTDLELAELEKELAELDKVEEDERTSLSKEEGPNDVLSSTVS